MIIRSDCSLLSLLAENGDWKNGNRTHFCIGQHWAWEYTHSPGNANRFEPFRAYNVLNSHRIALCGRLCIQRPTHKSLWQSVKHICEYSEFSNCRLLHSLEVYLNRHFAGTAFCVLQGMQNILPHFTNFYVHIYTAKHTLTSNIQKKARKLATGFQHLARYNKKFNAVV